MVRMMAPCASIVIASAITRPIRMLVRRIGLIRSRSIIPVSMSVTVAIPDCSAVNSMDRTIMPGRKKSKYESYPRRWNRGSFPIPLKIWENSTSQITGWSSEAMTSIGVRILRTTLRAPSVTVTGGPRSRCMTPPSVSGAEHAAHGALHLRLDAWALTRVPQEHVVQGGQRLFERGHLDPLGLQLSEHGSHGGSRIVDVDDQPITQSSQLNAGDVWEFGQ